MERDSAFVIDGDIKQAYLYTTMQRQLSISIKGALLIQEKEKLLKEIRDHAAELQNAMEKLKVSKAEITIESMPAVESDPGQIHQLFQNLISNGVKFRKPGSRPVVNISGRKKLIKSVLCCEIKIQDNGIGIKKEYQDAVSGVFQRLHTQKDYEGTGIGPAICKRVIGRHKGTISLESRPGKGRHLRLFCR